MIAYPLRVGSVTTRVLEGGGGGTPMVLIHGGGARADRWRLNVDPLAAAGYHVYALDLPGHGFATKGPDFDYSVPGFTEFLDAFLNEVGVARTVLVGTSLGGHLAAAFACRWPERAHALVLAGSLGLLPAGAETRERIRSGIVNTTRDGLRQTLLHVTFDPALVTEDLVEEEFRVNNSFGAGEALARLAAYVGDRMDDDVVGERLATAIPGVPTLLVWGAHERSVAVSVGEAAHRALPGSRFVVIRGAAHGPYQEKADAFNHVVTDFLKGSLGAWTSADVEYR